MKIYNNKNSKKGRKTWVVFGDSLTEYNSRAKYHYFDYVANDLNLDIVNFGISSTGYKNNGKKMHMIAFYKRIREQIKDIDFDVWGANLTWTI